MKYNTGSFTGVTEEFTTQRKQHIIQIAGIRDRDEAGMLVEEGVTDLAFPLGRGIRSPDTDEKTAGEIVADLPAKTATVLITYLHEPSEVLRLVDAITADKVQLHGPVSPEELAAIKKARPSLVLIKSLAVGSDVLDAQKWEPYVDAFLTDTFDPATGARGATGKTHDWRLSRDLAAATNRPLILAGGLKPENVAEAIRVVRPAGVDAHTGVEGPDGRKSRERVRAFVTNAKQAFSRRR